MQEFQVVLFTDKLELLYVGSTTKPYYFDPTKIEYPHFVDNKGWKLPEFSKLIINANDYILYQGKFVPSAKLDEILQELKTEGINNGESKNEN